MRHRSKLLLLFTAALFTLILSYVTINNFSDAVGAEPFVNPHGSYGAAGAGNGTALCSKCHSGHTALASDLLRQPTQREACYACHKSGLPNNTSPDIKGQFGENVIGQSVMASYHPVPTGILLCTSCHDPHLKPDQAGGTAALLSVGSAKVSSGTAVCAECHGPGNLLPAGDMITGFVYSAHENMNGPSSNTEIKCIRCHQPHGSPFDYLLRTDIVDENGVAHAVSGNNNTLCFACHTNAVGSYSGSTVFNAVYHGTKLSSSVAETVYPGTDYQAAQCLNCHEPHGKAGNQDYKRADGNALCTNCHDSSSKTIPAKYSYRGIEAYNATPHGTAEPAQVKTYYNLTSSGSLAWEKAGPPGQVPTPLSPGAAATAGQKGDVSSTNSTFWSTRSAVVEGDFDYQMYKFHIKENISEVKELSGKWVGYGEPTPGHPTELLIWNKTNQSWELLNTGQIGDPANPGTLSGSKSSNLANYIDERNDVYILARAKHDGTGPVISGVSVTNGGTSAIFNWTTDETANSYVYYGTTPGVYTNWYGDSSYVTTHALPVAGLTSSTDYYYQIRTTDKLGNQTSYPEQILHTSLAPSAPTGLSGPSADPGSGSVVSINLSWNPSIDIDPGDTVTYEVQVFANGSLYKTVAPATNSCSVSLDWEDGPRTVTWKVRAVDNHGIASAWAVSPTSFPHTGPVSDTCLGFFQGQPHSNLTASVTNRINYWGRQLQSKATRLKTQLAGVIRKSVPVGSLNLLSLDNDSGYSTQKDYHFSLNTDYVELRVSSVDSSVPAGYCDNCHDPHGKDSGGTGVPQPKQLLYGQDTGCFGGSGGCHSESQNSALGINIYQRFTAGSDPTSRHSISPAEQQANGTQLQCVNCHDPHLNTAQNPVIDPALSGDSANRYTILNVNNTVSNYINGSGDVYMMIKARHDGAPPLFTGGPTISSMSATGFRVSWFTNETAAGYVEYGTTSSYGTKVNTPGPYTYQSLNITGLTSGVNYHYRVTTVDQVGNYTYSEDRLVDPDPPVITYGPALINSTGTSITVTWNTNEVSTSWVDYVDSANWSVGNYAYSTGSDTAVTTHSVTLNGLQTGTEYHFRVRSQDYRGNLTTSSDRTFTMVQPPAAPSLIKQPDVWNYATNATVNLQWIPGVDPEGGPDQFSAQISSDNTFNNPAVTQTSGWVYDNNWNVTISNDDWLIWYWRVKARNPLNNMESVWSTVYSFGHQGVDTAPPVSCPIVYVWDGSKYEFLTDMAGSDLGLQTVPGKLAPIYPDLPLAIPEGRLQPKDGYYTLKFKTERDEVDMIDSLKLEAVDHPVGTDIALNDMNRVNQPHKMFTYSEDLRLIEKATYANNPVYSGGKRVSGVDITDLVKRLDKREAVGILGDDNQFTFDLGDLRDAKTIKLVMNGWTEYMLKHERKERVLKGKQKLVTAQNFLEILQPDGTWKREKISVFAGYTKTVVMDLSGKFPKGSKKYVVRIRGMLRPHFDLVAVDTSPQSNIQTVLLDPVNASLAYRGVSQMDKAPNPYYHYDIITDSKITHEGRFTRYGDVLPLLKETDDKLVVMDTGDELTVKFPALPPPKPGMVRSFIIRPWQYYKEYDSAKTEPMPFRKMDLSKWPKSLGDYPAELQKYVEEWNTRIHHAGEGKAEQPEKPEKPGFVERIKGFFSKVIDSIVAWWKNLFAQKPDIAYVKQLPYRQPPVDKSWKRYPEPHYSLNTNYVMAEIDNTQGAVYYEPTSAGFAMWDGTTDPSPSFPGTDASANKAKITAQDNAWWVTNAYPPNQNDGSYNYQMVKFNITYPVSKITSLRLYWQGYGEPNPAYTVAVNVWNFVYSRWDLVTDRAVTSDRGINYQNSIDYQPLCLKCHGGTVPPGVKLGSATRNIASTFPTDIHGGGAGAQYVNGSDGGGYSGNGMAAPYANGNPALPCTDCHDVHGSQNVYHLRENINKTQGMIVNGTDKSNNAQVTAYCNSCHPGTVAQFHAGCMSCHNNDHEGVVPPGADFNRACLSCHTHGGYTPPHGECHCTLNNPVKAF